MKMDIRIIVFAAIMLSFVLVVALTGWLDESKYRALRQISNVIPAVMLVALMGGISVIAVKEFPEVVPFIDIPILLTAWGAIEETFNCE